MFHHSFVVVMAYLWVATAQSLQHIALMTNAGMLSVVHFSSHGVAATTAVNVTPSARVQQAPWRACLAEATASSAGVLTLANRAWSATTLQVCKEAS